MKDSEVLLKEHGLKKTSIRMQVIDCLRKYDYALSQPELEEKFEQEVDRVTLYRTLNSLEEKGVLHRVFDVDGVAKYAICKETCTVNHHEDEHIHFHCLQCKSIFCIDIDERPRFILPQGYSIHQLNLQVQGYCLQCNRTST